MTGNWPAYIAFPIAFLLGSIPNAYILVKWKTGKDIRQLGSGNVGATNVIREAGKALGFTVLFLDALKGLLAVLIFSPQHSPILLACCAILGHVFTPFLGFKGGKGVAVGAGAALAIYPFHFILALVAWFFTLKIFKFISLASMVAAYVFALSALFTYSFRSDTLTLLALSFFLTWTHRSNIRRLLKGQEPPFNINR
jgi:acyl phosphate:glycerol-3-phosphate acyltransferase